MGQKFIVYGEPNEKQIIRLIDADELEKAFCEHCSMDCEGMGHKPMCACADMYMIDNAPTIEATPTIHAKWVSSDVPNSLLAKCTNCGFDTGSRSFKYCPMCSARMDGGETYETN